MNITEIAKMAGVSTSAVSRYLNNGYLSEEKKKAIREVIEKTGYRPSKQAQIMRTKKSKVIGVIVPKINSESVSRVVEGISEVLVKWDYQMILANTENNTDKEIEYLSLLNNNPVDGIIFLATKLQKKHHNILKKITVPIVITGQKYKTYPCVYHDDYNAAKELTKKIIEKGRRSIGCIRVTEEDEAAGRNRVLGFQDAMREAGLCLSPNAIKESDFSMKTGYETMRLLLADYPQIDGVFCATDNIAVGAMLYLKEAGKRLPEEVSLGSIGYTQLAKVVEPKLATVHLHYKTSGVESAKMLLDMIDGGNFTSKQIQLGYEIISEESI